jgi:hypothetical protein
VLLAITLAGWALAPRMVLAAWLAAWWWAIGVVLGAFVNAWLHALTGGAWGIPVRATAIALGRRMPWLLIGLVAIALGAKHLYPWAMQPDGEWLRVYARPAFVHAWLSPAFFTARLVGYGLLWWWLARPASFASKGRVAASLVVYAITISLAAVDLVMSLIPAWYSTGFGMLMMCSQALSGAAAAVFFATSHSRPEAPLAGRVPVSRDLGNLLLMWAMSWGYLAFMQFLVIWAEDLPREIAWYVPRLQTGWQWAGLALVVTQLAAPFLALLFRGVKDRPARLAKVAALMLASSAFDAAWLVLPSVDAHSPHAWWLQPLAFAGFALLLMGGIEPTASAAQREARVSHA